MPGGAEKFEDVAVAVKANVYFDGRVVSHTLFFKDGSKKTLGIIYPGTYNFNTAGPEQMDITSGSCRARLKGQDGWTAYEAGTSFSVPGGSSFEISVDQGLAEYVCSFS